MAKNHQADNHLYKALEKKYESDIASAKSTMIIYFDNPVTLAKTFSLRGIPTTILFNKKGEEFARVIGSINFSDPKFIDWLESYN